MDPSLDYLGGFSNRGKGLLRCNMIMASLDSEAQKCPFTCLQGDRLHFSSTAADELGKRYAWKWLEMTGRNMWEHDDPICLFYVGSTAKCSWYTQWCAIVDCIDSGSVMSHERSRRIEPFAANDCGEQPITSFHFDITRNLGRRFRKHHDSVQLFEMEFGCGHVSKTLTNLQKRQFRWVPFKPSLYSPHSFDWYYACTNQGSHHPEACSCPAHCGWHGLLSFFLFPCTFYYSFNINMFWTVLQNELLRILRHLR